MLNYDAVKNWDFGSIVQTYTERDSVLYALGVGIGANAVDSGQLRYVYEKHLQTVPTMATVLGSPGFWWRDTRTGVDWVKLVHGEQAIRVFKPDEILPAFEQARRWLKEYRVPVVVEIILERVTNIAMGTEINNITEFEDLAKDPATDAPTAISLLD